MKAIGDEHRVGEDFLHRIDVTFVQIGADSPNHSFDPFGNAFQKFSDRYFQAVGQDGYDLDLSISHSGRHQHHEISMPLAQRDLIQTELSDLVQNTPIQTMLDPTIQQSFDLFVTEIFFEAHILDRRIDQLQEETAFEGPSIGAVRRIPLQLLRGGRLVLTIQTPVSLRPQPEIRPPLQNWQMAQRNRFIVSMRFGDDLPTLPALSSFDRALNRDHDIAAVVGFRPQHPDIGNAQRECDLYGCLIVWLLAFHSYIMPIRAGDDHKI